MQERVKPNIKVALAIDKTLAAAGVDLAALLEQALQAKLQADNTQAPSEADRTAIEAYHRYVEEHGTLADALRQLIPPGGNHDSWLYPPGEAATRPGASAVANFWPVQRVRNFAPG